MLESPKIILVDDDHHSARLMTRALAIHGAPNTVIFSDPELALEGIRKVALQEVVLGPYMVLVDLKSTSAATRQFVARLNGEMPTILVAAMAPTLDRTTRNLLLGAGASAVFERHPDITAFRAEAACIVSFLLRNRARANETPAKGRA